VTPVSLSVRVSLALIPLQVLLLLAGDVLEACVAAVRQLKGITATYRMTAKGPPVRHSHYVAGGQPLVGTSRLLDRLGPEVVEGGE